MPLFDHMGLCQGLLHHCFVYLLKNIVAVLGREKVFCLVFSTTTTRD